MAKVYSLTIRNRAAAAVLGVGIVALGAVFLTLGVALLLGLVVAGGAIGAGIAGYRMLRGPSQRRQGRAADRFDFERFVTPDHAVGSGLDPALEVKPVVKAIVRPIERGDREG